MHHAVLIIPVNNKGMSRIIFSLSCIQYRSSRIQFLSNKFHPFIHTIICSPSHLSIFTIPKIFIQSRTSISQIRTTSSLRIIHIYSNTTMKSQCGNNICLNIGIIIIMIQHLIPFVISISKVCPQQ